MLYGRETIVECWSSSLGLVRNIQQTESKRALVNDRNPASLQEGLSLAELQSQIIPRYHRVRFSDRPQAWAWIPLGLHSPWRLSSSCKAQHQSTPRGSSRSPQTTDADDGDSVYPADQEIGRQAVSLAPQAEPGGSSSWHQLRHG